MHAKDLPTSIGRCYKFVIPAKAVNNKVLADQPLIKHWIPAFAGMTSI